MGFVFKLIEVDVVSGTLAKITLRSLEYGTICMNELTEL